MLALVFVLLPAVGMGQPLAHSNGSLPKGCGSCHVGHGLAGSAMLPAREEGFCFGCHGSTGGRARAKADGRLAGGVTLRDVSVDFRRPYRHPVERTTAVHTSRERLPERDSRARRHVECADCHRPHRTVRLATPTFGRRLQWRSSLDGFEPEYRLCYRCHADSANRPRTSTNVARRFAPSSRSFHAVEAPGRASYVPSLRSPWTTGSRVSCSDCHGNDTGRGMHGSRFRFLLRRGYVASDGTAESSRAYATCYACHDRTSLYSGRGFSEHRRHVRDARISCASCHNAHGSETSPYLLEFAAGVVLPEPESRRLSHVPEGRGRGRCYLSCHGVVHKGAVYCEGGGPCEPGRLDAPLRKRSIRRNMRRSPFSF